MQQAFLDIHNSTARLLLKGYTVMEPQNRKYITFAPPPEED